MVTNPLYVLGFVALIGVAVYFLATGIVDIYPAEEINVLRRAFFPEPSTSTPARQAPARSSSLRAPATEPAPRVDPRDIPPGYTVAQLSPYFKKIRIGSAYSSGGAPPTAYRHVSLSPSLSSGERVNVTGWRIRTKRDEVQIPRAVAVYDPFGFAAPQDILLANGEYLNIYSSRSNIGQSFRLNRCTGYLEVQYRFKPALPLSCPSVYQSRSEIIHLSNRCQEHITSLSTCGFPDTNRVPPEDSACNEFLRDINYGGCFRKHRSDRDFFSGEWRVFLGDTAREPELLDPVHDRIELLDLNGKLVDQYVY